MSRGKLDLATLTPTATAAKYHFYQVYYQIQLWRGVNLDPGESNRYSSFLLCIASVNNANTLPRCRGTRRNRAQRFLNYY